MLAVLGFATVGLLLTAIISGRLSPLVALIAVPTIAAVLAGMGGQIGPFVLSGLQQTAPVAAMFVFAILYFGVMTDAGLLDPIVNRILRGIGCRPRRVVMGAALLALLVHLDGSGAVTFLVTIPAILPLFERLRMDKRILACVTSMAAGVNFLPWTGPMLRASAALHISTADLFRPLIPVQIIGLVFVFGVAFMLGTREERRLNIADLDAPALTVPPLTPEQARTRRPDRFWINAALTAVVMAVMISGRVDPAAAILLAAAAFTGIMKESGLLAAMADAAVRAVPAAAAQHLPFLLGLLSRPLSLLFDPDSFYLGALPIVAQVGSTLGVPPIQIAQAALLGQMTTGFPISPLTPATVLVVGLTGIELGDHQRFTGPYLFAASVVMTIACVVFGVFPL